MNTWLLISDDLDKLKYLEHISNSTFPKSIFFTTTKIKSALSILSSHQTIDVIIYYTNQVNSNYLSNIEKLNLHSNNIIIISVNDCLSKFTLTKLFSKGINGCISSTETETNFIKLLSILKLNIVPISPKLITILTNIDYIESVPLDVNLTNREYEVYELLAEGLSNKVIAYSLKLSIYTIADHVKSIFYKMNVHSRSEIIKKRLNIY
jgi:DNA-binding NarL/FixJ family response regulator